MPVKKGGSGRSRSLARSFLANIRSPSPPMSRTVPRNNNIDTEITNGYQFLRQHNLNNSYRVSNNPITYHNTITRFEISNNRPVRVITNNSSNRSMNQIIDHTFFVQIRNNQNRSVSQTRHRSLPIPRYARQQ
jgi:hypothetical protein